MKRALLAGVLLGALLFTGVAVAQQEPPGYTAYGHGVNSCGSWLEARRNRTEMTFAAWVLGFVSGVGYIGPTLKHTDSDGLLAFIDTYCTAHPLDSIAKASAALVKELMILKTP